MKKMNRIFAVAALLASAASMATIIQPVVPVKEDAPFRILVGGGTGLVKNDQGFGINHLGFGLGFAHTVGYDFTWSLSAGFDYAGISAVGEGMPGYSRLFTDDTKDAAAKLMAINAQLGARFMPEIAEAAHLGALIAIGYDYNIRDRAAAEAAKKIFSFGDLSFKAGLAGSFGFTDMVSLYLAPAVTLTEVRFFNSELPEAGREPFKKMRNHLGMEIPVGLWFATGENIALFVETNAKFASFKNFTKSWKQDINLGLSFAL